MLEWVRDNLTWKAGRWVLRLMPDFSWQVDGEEGRSWDNGADAKDWCESQEQAAKPVEPAEPLPAVGSVWEVPGGGRRVIWAHSNDEKRVYWIDAERRRFSSLVAEWHAWVRETGAVDLLADLLADREVLLNRAEEAEAMYKIASGERDQFAAERNVAETGRRQMICKANELRDQCDRATKRAETAEHQRDLWQQDSRDKAAEAERWKVLAQDADLKYSILERNAQNAVESIAEERDEMKKKMADEKKASGEIWNQIRAAETERDALRESLGKVGRVCKATGEMRLESFAECVERIVKERDELRAKIARLNAPVEGEPEWVESFAKGIDWKISTGYACEIATWVRKLIRERDRYARYLDVIEGSYPVRPSGGYPNDAVPSLKALASEARKGGGS